MPVINLELHNLLMAYLYLKSVRKGFNKLSKPIQTKMKCCLQPTASSASNFSPHQVVYHGAEGARNEAVMVETALGTHEKLKLSRLLQVPDPFLDRQPWRD